VASNRTHLLGVIGARPGAGADMAALNLGVALAQLGRRTVVADFGLADLRGAMGLFRKVEGLAEFARAECRAMGALVHSTPVPNLGVIGPGHDANGAAPFAYPAEQKVRLMRALAALEADFVLADLGTEFTEHGAEFVSMANAGIVVVSSEPSEVLRTYEFLKSVMYRTIHRRLGPDSEMAALIAELGRAGNGQGTPTIAHVIGHVGHREPDEAQVIEEICENFAPLLIVNAGRPACDLELGDKLRIICRRYLSARLTWLGFMYEDPGAEHANADPVVIRAPGSRAAVAIRRIAHKCAQSRRLAEARPDRLLFGPPPRPAAAATSDGAHAIEELLARVVRREIGEVEQQLHATARQARTSPESGKPAAGSPAAGAGAGVERILKTAFEPADIRALEALIDSLDENHFPDEKWRWRVRALTAPEHVVRYLVSRGVRRDFFYSHPREARHRAPQATPA